MKHELNHQLVLVEGREYPNGLIVKPNAIEILDDRVGVGYGFDWSREPLGYADNFVREDTGEIYMDLHLDTPLELRDLELFDVNIYAIKIKRDEEDINVIAYGLLRAVSFTAKVPNWHIDEEVRNEGKTTTGH